jgi:CRISPR-associated protein Csb1
LGAKFQRVLVSEIVGYDVVAGVKTSSRIDPLGIERQDIYELKDDPSDWTPLPQDAAVERKKPKKFSRGTAKENRGTPAAINHGNIPPRIDEEAGGITMSHGVHSVVLSLAGLRRLRFRQRSDGSPIPPAERDRAETAARTALAALALAGVVYQRRTGYDLRSRSLLVPSDPLNFELLHRDGGDPLCLTVDDPAVLVRTAAEAAAAEGLGWESTPIRLRPTKKLEHLVIKSRELDVAYVTDAEAGD